VSNLFATAQSLGIFEQRPALETSGIKWFRPELIVTGDELDEGDQSDVEIVRRRPGQAALLNTSLATYLLVHSHLRNQEGFEVFKVNLKQRALPPTASEVPQHTVSSSVTSSDESVTVSSGDSTSAKAPWPEPSPSGEELTDPGPVSATNTHHRQQVQPRSEDPGVTASPTPPTGHVLGWREIVGGGVILAILVGCLTWISSLTQKVTGLEKGQLEMTANNAALTATQKTLHANIGKLKADLAATEALDRRLKSVELRLQRVEGMLGSNTGFLRQFVAFMDGNEYYRPLLKAAETEIKHLKDS